MQIVLSTFRRQRVRALLMGGQACVLYGAAEFTRDSDFLASADAANVNRLHRALRELNARRVYDPDLSLDALLRGHACHFEVPVQSGRPWRVDVMSKLRGTASFAQLWKRRTVLDSAALGRICVLDIRDLVIAKKTQRDKDWPMIARLVEADFASHGHRPTPREVRFWLLEARSADLLGRLVRRFGPAARRLASRRAALQAALGGDSRAVESALSAEQSRERELDRAYWQPLREELARLRRRRDADSS